MEIIFNSQDHPNELTLCGQKRHDRFCFFRGRDCYKVFGKDHEQEFRKERDILTLLDGIPGVCHIEEVGLALMGGEEFFCIHMPFYGSRDILMHLSTLDGKAMGEEYVISVFKSLSETFYLIEGKGVRHNDIASANILYSDGGYHLIDFGSAISLEEIQDGTYHRKAVEGHAGYTAPEKQGGTILPESDIFSLGKLFSEIIGIGKAAGQDYSERLGGLVAKCQGISPEQRFRSFGEVLDALDRLPLDSGEPGRPGESTAEQSWQQAERPRETGSRADKPATPPRQAAAPVSPATASPGREKRQRARGMAAAWMKNTLYGLVTAVSVAVICIEAYMTFRHYTDDPVEQDILHHPTLKKDIQFIINEIKNNGL